MQLDLPAILDPCCGSRSMWFDRQHPDVLYGDQRREQITVTDNSRGNASGTHWITFLKPEQNQFVKRFSGQGGVEVGG